MGYLVRNTKISKLIRMGIGRLFEVGNHVVVEDDYIRSARRVADNPRLGLIYSNRDRCLWVVVWLIPGRSFSIVKPVEGKRPPLKSFSGANWRTAELAKSEIRRLQEYKFAEKKVEIERALRAQDYARTLRKLNHNQNHPVIDRYKRGEAWVPVTDDEQQRSKEYKPKNKEIFV